MANNDRSSNIPFPRVENTPVFAVQRPGGRIGPLPWADRSRKNALIAVGVLLLAILVAVVIGLVIHSREQAAAVSFGDAMQVYQAPVSSPTQPIPPGVKAYGSTAERAAAASKLFAETASKYGSTTDGKTAQYFVGVTDMEQGQNASAEATFKQVAGYWDGNLSALAKLALADLYRQTGRDSDAIALYNQLAAKPTDTVPAATARISLAELYTAEGKTEQARTIYAELKDKDKSAKGQPGVASTIASEKLNPKPVAAAPGAAGQE